ncbi:hypothetical protein FACS189451_00330 [Bacteroidia bacterium]|nr:hypothetical protein FACS189451_00330 [Bacteroidia bacterium]
MSKRVDTSGINPDFVIAQTKSSNREQKPDTMPPPEPQVVPEETVRPEPVPVEAVPPPATEPSGELTAAESVHEVPTAAPRKRKRGQVETYDDVFLKRKELKTRQSVYISQEIHASIARLVHVLALAGKDISVGGYIDNVLSEHLESHKDVIAEMFRQQLDQFL